MEITIRRVIKEDAAVFSALSKKTFYDTFTGTCTEQDMDELLEEYFNIPLIETQLEVEDDYFYFAEYEGTPIGLVRFKEDYEEFEAIRQWKSLELKRLYVLKEYHGMGVAQQLMDFVLDYAYSNQFEVVWLGVWEFNFRAQKFYDKNGFTFTGHSHPYPISNTPQTDLWYWRFLNK